MAINFFMRSFSFFADFAHIFGIHITDIMFAVCTTPACCL